MTTLRAFLLSSIMASCYATVTTTSAQVWRPAEREREPYGVAHRTCGYCGSIHPADLVTYLQDPDLTGRVLGLMLIVTSTNTDVTGCSVQRARDVDPRRFDSYWPNDRKPMAYGQYV